MLPQASRLHLSALPKQPSAPAKKTPMRRFCSCREYQKLRVSWASGSRAPEQDVEAGKEWGLEHAEQNARRSQASEVGYEPLRG